ncbi:MAG: hypothetical protein DWQ31_16785 [Planctomycetota bacterium]|nr:MAG: hypothetical protein DWQ31_16785 [Planctomycetota bacterium]REJ92010.1 MAG: hypothetical protein DWQ35_12735 [Planctomycetota bacterium]REK28546.1 MAG: hypothetical protein DWQ42_04325 [Planctomycetota bacterium]REK39161.1 MAG: hypothetical protein DWQ46_17910 [Planctomycetota bacterium]
MGWAGTAMLLVGAWRLASKDRNALLWTMAGAVCWTIKGISTAQLDLIVVNLAFVILTFRTWLKWNSDAET